MVKWEGFFARFQNIPQIFHSHGSIFRERNEECEKNFELKEERGERVRWEKGGGMTKMALIVGLIFAGTATRKGVNIVEVERYFGNLNVGRKRAQYSQPKVTSQIR